ncbi:aggregation promoting factor surface protein [Lactobacillus intestinalis]|uniref:aggregation-promoting factor C-terminal-like domain-containing protein n=1 Tax=Lactobacillus intestinalis TaxID=151781 RepID=UPI00261EB503|nr:aggregation promoting factor surface protein [Lactobacillus intestinalis]
MKNVKSTLVKLFAALALVLATVVTVQAFNANTSTSQTAQAAIKLSKKEKAAKHWIAMRESGGSYTARNGVCYGRYQLNIGYLHGDYSKKNQERTADNYVYGRYGSWVNAKKFWLAHHWY